MTTTTPTAPSAETSRPRVHGQAAASAGLAAAIAMAVSQIIGWFFGLEHLAETLLYGLSVSAVAFGGTYAGAFFTSLAVGRTRRP